jgi:hypothetical protein
MAIKGKTKSRAKTHRSGRPPRRGPVPVPTPFFLRRWVQLAAVFLLGLGAFALGVWVTNGLRQDRNEKAAAAAAATRAAALQQWQTEVERQLGTVAQMQGGSGSLQPPAVSPDVSAAVDALGKGDAPASKPKDLAASEDALGKAADALDNYDLSGTLRDQGFGSEIEGIFASRTEFVAALRGYQNAASLARIAMTTQDKELSASIAARAKSTLDSANTSLQDAWSKYVFALQANNLITIAPTGSGLGAGGLPGGLGGLPGSTG